MSVHGKTLIFLHITKTAGTTMQKILRTIYDKDEILLIKSNPKNNGIHYQDFIRLPSSERSRFRVLMGHMPWGLHRYCPNGAEYFTFLRDPLKRGISTYFHCFNKPKHHHHEIARQISIQEYLNRYYYPYISSFLDDIDNPVSMQNPIKDPVLVTSRIERYFPIIGISERFNESLELLQHRYAWNIPKFENHNIGKYSRRDISFNADAINEFHRTHQDDYRLYLFARRRFIQQWKRHVAERQAVPA